MRWHSTDLTKVYPLDLAPHPWRNRAQRAILPLARLLFPITVEVQGVLASLLQPCIFAANHGSHLDSLAVLAALPDALRDNISIAAAADYWYTSAPRRAAVSLLNGFPFPRQGSAGLRHAAGLLRAGRSVLIYPQGTRAGGAFKGGVGILAVQTGCPVIPVTILGSAAAWPKGQALPRRRPLTVRFGTPLAFASDCTPSVATMQIETAVLALLAGDECTWLASAA